MSKERWTPKEQLERQRLFSRESDWNLAGSGGPPVSRTRGNGVQAGRPVAGAPVGSPQLASPPPIARVAMMPADSNETLVCGPVTKPPSRAIVEIDPFVGLLNKHLSNCPDCVRQKKRNKLSVSFSSVSVATSIHVVCDVCGHQTKQKPSITNTPLPDEAGSALIERNSNCATNVLHFLAFLTKGGGGAEASHFAGLMGLQLPRQRLWRRVASNQSRALWGHRCSCLPKK